MLDCLKGGRLAAESESFVEIVAILWIADLEE
jgi:hypothetical protein